jgi:hypothetical protein
VIHIGSTDSIDRATLSRKAAVLLGYPDARIVTASAALPAGGRAPRHRNGIIAVDKARGLLRTPLLTVEQSLHRAIVERS